MQEERYPEHKENFEVVLLKKGVSSLTASPDDFKRVAVEASSPLAAHLDDSVLAEKDYVVLFTAKPGVATEPEIMARRRVMEGSPIDRSKL